MEAMKNGTTYARLPYRALDVIEFSMDVPDHGVRAGERGQTEALNLRTNGNEVVTTIRVPYSTGQTRCRLEVNVRSYAGSLYYIRAAKRSARGNRKGKGKDWVEKTLGLTAEVVRHPPKSR